MIYPLHTFAATKTEPGLMGVLGIDWQLLLFQGLAFLLLVWFLKKFVYPPLVKAIDARQDAIEQSAKAAAETETHAKQAEAKVNELLKEARKEADGIVVTAHKEATATAADAEVKAKKQADYIVSEAKEQLQQDIRDARRALRGEATELVALATEKIVKQKVDAQNDKALINASLKESE